MFSRKLKADIPGKQIRKNIWLGDNSEIHSSAVINGPVVIGRNCHIKENVTIDEFTSIGDNCIIEEGASLQRSTIWSNSYIGRNARISGSILCRQSTLKQNAVTSEGVILGDRSFVGKGAVINPHVKIWPEKKIEAGATVSLSLIWGGRWQGSLFGNDGISGLANIEITPEFALKFGAAFGSSLEKGATLITSRDAHPASRMINRSIICGLASVGVNIQDLRVMPAPISRYTTRNGLARGGIHTRISPTDSRSFLLEFFDKRGINIDKNTERKIENIFFREDFRRTSLEEVGDIGFPSRALEHYTEGFFHHLDSDSIRKAEFKVVIDYAYNTSSLILPVLLGKLGCETVAINAYLDSKKELQAQEDRGKFLSQLSKVVTTLKADLGILLADDAERIILIDENGTIISDTMSLVLMAHLVLKSHTGAVVAVPVSAPSIMDRLAHEQKGSILRTKLDSRSVMHAASIGEKKILFAGKEKGYFIFPKFHPSFDGMFAFARILELLAHQKITISRAIDEVPGFFQAEKSVECSFQDKGRVMRKLIEQNRDKPVDIIDGIKIYFDGAWVLIVPDPTEPIIQVVAESSSAEKAEEILSNYEKVIEALKVEDENSPASRPLIQKKSALRREETTEYRRMLPQEKSFHFWVPGRYLGKRAQSMKEFCDALHCIEIESVEYHMEREDFANWIEYELENEIMAGKIRSLKARGHHGEELRQEIIRLMQYKERM